MASKGSSLGFFYIEASLNICDVIFKTINLCTNLTSTYSKQNIGRIMHTLQYWKIENRIQLWHAS